MISVDVGKPGLFRVLPTTPRFAWYFSTASSRSSLVGEQRAPSRSGSPAPSGANVMTDSNAFGSRRDSPCSRRDPFRRDDLGPGDPLLEVGPVGSVHHEVPLPRRRETRTPAVVVVNPSGPHHCDRCRTSVNASNTTSHEALMTREITISRSARRGLRRRKAHPVLSRPSSLLLSWRARVPARICPAGRSSRSRTARIRPSTRGPVAARARVEAVQRLLACLAGPHQSDFPEHPAGVLDAPGWVSPNSWANSVTGRSPGAQQHQDLPALRLGDGR